MTAETHGSVPAAPREGMHDGRLNDLVDSLIRARRRSELRTFINGILTSVAIGFGLFILLELANAVLGALSPILSFEWLSVPAWMTDWRDAPLPQHIIVSIIAAVAAFIVSIFTVAARRPGIGRMARAADRRFAMEERLSTALELAQSPDKSPGVIREALLQDAARRAAMVDVRSLSPLGLHWQAIIVPVLAVIAALVVITPPAPLQISSAGATHRTATTQTVGTNALTPDERAATAGQLRAIAAILAQDGQARSDPTLQAVAAELLALGNEVEANPALNRGDLGDQLQRLLDATNDAYAANGIGPADAGNRTQLLDDTLRAVDPDRYRVTEDPNAGREAPGLETPRDHTGLAGADVPTEGPIDLPPAAGTVAAENVDVVEGANVPDELNHNLVEPDNPYADDDLMSTPDDAPDNVAVNPEVAVVGFGEGAGGNLAGLGTAELFDAEGRPIDILATNGEMRLLDADPGNGRMITLNLPPMTELRAVNEDGLTTGIWQALDEHEVTRTQVPAAALEAVGRYFQAIQAERGE